MQINFERTGGFSGMRMTVNIDTESLSSKEACELHELVNSSNYFELPAVIASSTFGADRFCYRITVEDQGRKHTVQMTDEAIPDELQQLFSKLMFIARPSHDS